MTLLTKILLGTGAGLGLFLLLTTPEERFKLLAPPMPEPPEPNRPPRPIPVPQRAAFANLPIGTIVTLRGGPGLPGEPDIPRGDVTILEKHQPPPELGVTVPWHYTGRPTRNTAFGRVEMRNTAFDRVDIRFDERDIERLVAVPPSPI